MPLQKSSAFKSKDFCNAGFCGGAVAGFVVVIFVVSMKWLGYAELSLDEFALLWPRMIFLATIGGAGGGFLGCQFALFFERTEKESFKKPVLRFCVFMSGFVIIVIVHQLSVRDALLKASPLGGPNFETLATGLLGGTAFLIMVKELSKIRATKTGAGLKTAAKATIIGVTLWSLIFVIYFVLTEFGVFAEKQPLFAQFPTLFFVEFPRPEHSVHCIVGCLFYVSSVLTSAAKLTKPPVPELSRPDKEFVNRIKGIIADKMEEPGFGAQELAQQALLHRVHLNRKLKGLTGLNTTHFIRAERLKKAAKLLRQSTDNITEIAYKVGFEDLNYFSRCFKSHFNLSPRAYRERIKPSHRRDNR